MTNESLLALWRERLIEFSRSGLGVSAWCASHEIPVHRYYYWRRRLSDLQLPSSGCGVNWLSLPVLGDAPPAGAGLSVRVGAASIDVAPGFDPVLLRDVVAALAPAVARC